ncbi:MAG: antibiotic biosynthesis monooxygenase [Gammaproteobacteria bacterium]|nr:antibiotic biosynthesis monooxygenase [Gammaproteobacteria bacterium]
MYARLFSFRSTPDNREAIEAMADGLYAFTKSLDGFVSATYMVSEDEQDYSSLTVWETREAAMNAGESIRQKSSSMLAQFVTVPPETVVNEVYEPRS